MFESTPDCIRLLDIDGRPLLMNRAGRQLFGLDENATLEDVAWRDLVHRSAEGPDDACRNGGTARVSNDTWTSSPPRCSVLPVSPSACWQSGAT
nr:PAS domain-containing protein [Sinorhizobium meliloti]